MQKLIFFIFISCILTITGCSSLDPVEQERRAVYEQQKKRDAIDRSQREANAASKRLDKALK